MNYLFVQEIDGDHSFLTIEADSLAGAWKAFNSEPENGDVYVIAVISGTFNVEYEGN